MFSVVRAKYQKGDLKDSFTGAVYFRGKPRYRNNDTFKEKVNAKLLTENVRWNRRVQMLHGQGLPPPCES